MGQQQSREERDQMALFSWARHVHMPPAPDTEAGAVVADYLHAIPNGGRRNAREAARLKRAGVLAGVSDAHLPLARAGFVGLWIELKPIVMKRPAGGGPIRPSYERKPEPTQRAWLDRMTSAGHLAVVCWGWEAARDTVWQYLQADATRAAEPRHERRIGGSP